MTQTSQRTYFLCGSLLLLLMAGCSSHHRPTASYNSHAYDGIIYAAAAQYNLDPKLIKAIIRVESSYNPSAVSPSNAIGLMQIKADGAGCDAYRYGAGTAVRTATTCTIQPPISDWALPTSARCKTSSSTG